MTESITLDLTEGTEAVSLDLSTEDITLDLATEPAVWLNLSGGENVMLDCSIETEEITLDFTTETVVLDLADQSVSISTSEPETITFEVTDTGPMGPQGPKGDPGPPGPAGEGASFVWSQSAADVLWTITHDVPYRPNVTVVDSAGTVLIADVTYLDDVTVLVTHGYPTAGYAYLS